MLKGIGKTQKAVLDSLRRAPATVTQIAANVGAGNRTVRQSLKSLESRGMVAKEGLAWALLEAPGGLFNRPAQGFGLCDFLSACVAFVEQDGYLSRLDAGPRGSMATADRAMGLIAFRLAGQDPTPGLMIQRGTQRDWVAYRETARRIQDRATALIVRCPHGDYEKEVAQVVRDGVVSSSTAGYAASLLGYVDDLERKKNSINWPKVRDASDYFGLKGDRVELRIVVLHAKDFDSYYRKKTLVQFVTEGGNVCVWWASSKISWARVGEAYRIKATIASHELNTHGGTPFRETKVKYVRLLVEEVAAGETAEGLEKSEHARRDR